AAVFEGGRVRIDPGAMMAASPPSEIGGRRSEEIAELIDLFSKTQYRAKEVGPRVRNFSRGLSVEMIEKRCLELFGRDYRYSIIHNASGEICGHYPRQIVFLEYECTEPSKDRFESTVQISKLGDLVNRSKMARCRGRFVCPVILYNGKHICRSSTLAGWGELYGRTGYNYIFSGGSDDAWAETEEVPEDEYVVRNGDSQLFDKVRGYDIKLLRYLSVRYICDLMVENKKVKFGLNVTSSEKVDKAQRYADFTLLSVPYPGCEFFKDYKDRDYTAEGLVFNWNQDFVDAPLTIPACFTRNLNIDWTAYRSWDLVEQTQNYLRLLIHIINSDDESGLLVHCISGWDRTPLFVSLLRLSLWAVSRCHPSHFPIDSSHVSYISDFSSFAQKHYTLLKRTSKTTHIFFFCFNFLKHIVSEKFSAIRKQRLVQRKVTTSSPQTVFWNRPVQLDDRLPHPLMEGKSSSSSSSQSEQGFPRTGSSPLAVPGRRLVKLWVGGSSLSTEYGSWQIVSGCGSIHDHTGLQGESPIPFSFQDEGPSGRISHVSERQSRLEAVREVFLAAYSSTVGLKSSAPSPSGAISGLLEHLARGVGLRSNNAII
uniref:Myotubularin related protein 14 n=1 Tax=Denticeps clupeoides TaxID=299321 RepID=A0AAY4E1M6_9TELE